MYYDAEFYKILVRSWRVEMETDAVVIKQRDGENERRVAYSEMTAEEARALCHYVGRMLSRFREMF